MKTDITTILLGGVGIVFLALITVVLMILEAGGWVIKRLMEAQDLRAKQIIKGIKDE